MNKADWIFLYEIRAKTGRSDQAIRAWLKRRGYPTKLLQDGSYMRAAIEFHVAKEYEAQCHAKKHN
jgi:hypothetical protein